LQKIRWFSFITKDFYYTPDEDKSIYAFCMTMPEVDKKPTIIILIKMQDYLDKPAESVSLLENIKAVK